MTVDVLPAQRKASVDDEADALDVWSQVQKVQAGDTAAFGPIYKRYVDTVFRFVYFRCGNKPLAEDITSETFTKALRSIGSFTWQGRDFGAFLVTIARNLIADHFKSGKFRLEVTTGDVLDADREDRSPEGSPETAVIDSMTNRQLVAAVKELNPEQRECVVFRFFRGYSVAETAQAMDRNEGAVKALQYRATRALARLLDGGIGDYEPEPTTDTTVLARRWCLATGVPLGPSGVVTASAMTAYKQAMEGAS